MVDGRPACRVGGRRSTCEVVDDGTAAGRQRRSGETAANLFNPGESDIDARRPAADRRPGPRRPGDRRRRPRPARSEWWWPLALAALRPAARRVAPLPSPDASRAGARCCGAAGPRRAGGRRRCRRSRVIPVAFTDPIWLWLLLPAVALVVGGWLGRLAHPAPRRAGSRRSSSAWCWSAASSRRWPARGSRCRRIGSPSSSCVDASASMLDATREELLDFAREAVGEMPEGDTAGVVVFGAQRPGRPAAVRPRRAAGARHRCRSSARPTSRRRCGSATAIFPAGTQQRLVLLSDGNDTGGAGGGRRSWRPRSAASGSTSCCPAVRRTPRGAGRRRRRSRRRARRRDGRADRPGPLDDRRPPPPCACWPTARRWRRAS